MKRILMLPLLALALPLAGQQVAQPPAPSAPGDKIVAVINGETVTAARLDQLLSRIPPKTRDQYKTNGGGGGLPQQQHRKAERLPGGAQRGGGQKRRGGG